MNVKATLSDARYFATKYSFGEIVNKDARRFGFVGENKLMRLDFFPRSSALRVYKRGYIQKYMRQITVSALGECFKFPQQIKLDPLPTPVKAQNSPQVGYQETLKVPKVDTASWGSFKVDQEGFVEAFTDGACIDNGKVNSKAGIGIWWGRDHKWNISQPIMKSHQTNNGAEIQAASVAIKLAATNGIDKLLIKTDSQYVIDCVTMWMPKWKKNGWMTKAKQPVKNRQDLQDLDEAINLTKIQVKWRHVKSHDGIEGNEEADKLAVKGAAWRRDCEDNVDVSRTKPGEPCLDAGTSSCLITVVLGKHREEHGGDWDPEMDHR